MAATELPTTFRSRPDWPILRRMVPCGTGIGCVLGFMRYVGLEFGLCSTDIVSLYNARRRGGKLFL